MILRSATLALILAGAMPALPLRAADVPALVPAGAARAALDRACAAMRAAATEGGYLWRYSPDLTVRGGEVSATATQVWVQPPGTPAMGQAFLAAWTVTGDPVHLAAARAAALALVRGQLESGGWDYLIEFDPAKRGAWRYRVDGGTAAAKAKNMTTFDDNNTQGALSFLLSFVDAAKSAPDPADAGIREALDFGLHAVIAAQYPNGAWPQRWGGERHDPVQYPVLKAAIPADYPREQPSTGYYSHYTFNDGAHRDLVLMLVDAARRTGREDCREAARRGAEFLLLAQLPEPQPAWAQQYDARMQPAWARAFEPPSVSSAESVGVIRLLMEVYVEFGDERYLAAIPPAIAWLRRSEIAPGRWARLYELGTNRPIYGDRDRKIHYTLTEVSEERREGYGWEGGFDVLSTIERYEKLVADGRDKVLRKRVPTPLDAERRASRQSKASPLVRNVIDRLDSEGRWLTQGSAKRVDPSVRTWIETGEFIRNTRVLCDYLALFESK
jgi:PelA/Pel-15E family pectate lyase